MGMRLVNLRIDSGGSSAPVQGNCAGDSVGLPQGPRGSAYRYSRFLNLINRMSYEENTHVVESNEAAGVAYVISGKTVGIATAQNGSITMPLKDFKKIMKEAQDVFGFWAEETR